MQSSLKHYKKGTSQVFCRCAVEAAAQCKVLTSLRAAVCTSICFSVNTGRETRSVSVKEDLCLSSKLRTLK